MARKKNQLGLIFLLGFVVFIFSQVLVFAQEGAISEGQPTGTPYFSTVPEIPIFSTPEPTFTPFYSVDEGSVYEQGNEPPTLMPTATGQPQTEFPTSANLIGNHDFMTQSIGNSGDAWGLWGQVDANFQSSGGNSYLQFRRQANATAASILQETTNTIPINNGLSLYFDLGNSDSTKVKRVTVIARNVGWDDQVTCVFWLPKNTPLTRFYMYGTTTKAWTGASISFYDGSTEPGTGWIQLDNVSMVYDASVAVTGLGGTKCQERPTQVLSGAPTTNLLANPTFLNPISPNDKWFFLGSPNNSATDGILEISTTASPFLAGQVFQDTNQASNANTVLTLYFNAANNSSGRKRISIILNDPAWTGTYGIRFCGFWLEPNSPMRTYRMWTHTDANWGSTQLSVYEASGGGTLQLDNFHLRVGGSVGSVGTECRVGTATGIAVDPRPTYSIQIADPSNSAWKTGETAAINRGVEQFASALFNYSTYPTSTEEVFNRIIPPTAGVGSVLFVRGNVLPGDPNDGNPANDIPDIPTTYINAASQQISVTYPNVNHGNCFAFDGGGSLPRAIVCNGTFTMSEYTVVHELGHLLDYRSGSILTNAMYSNASISISTCPVSGNRVILMGYVNDPNNPGFRRGNRGWGSGVYISNFQQSPENTPFETAADMFLNWVYRSNSLNSSTSIITVPTNAGAPVGCPSSVIPEPWSGFLNIDWDNPNAGFDLGMSGEVRYGYMNQVLRNVFTAKPTW